MNEVLVPTLKKNDNMIINNWLESEKKTQQNWLYFFVCIGKILCVLGRHKLFTKLHGSTAVFNKYAIPSFGSHSGTAIKCPERQP